MASFLVCIIHLTTQEEYNNTQRVGLMYYTNEEDIGIVFIFYKYITIKL